MLFAHCGASALFCPPMGANVLKIYGFILITEFSEFYTNHGLITIYILVRDSNIYICLLDHPLGSAPVTNYSTIPFIFSIEKTSLS